jgi:signal transduction histidine kinase
MNASPSRIPKTNSVTWRLSLTALFERLEESFEKLQRFTSDVSHELRTPLAAIRSVGEVGLQEEHDAEKYRDIIGSMLEEVGKLTAMIDTLLTIAHADSGAIQLQQTTFALMDLVQEAVAVVGVLAEDKEQTLSMTGDQRVLVCADRAFLRMALVNLLDNAVKYSPAGSSIRVSLHIVGSDTGPRGLWNSPSRMKGPGFPRVPNSECSTASTGWTKPVRVTQAASGSDCP